MAKLSTDGLNKAKHAVYQISESHQACVLHNMNALGLPNYVPSFQPFP